MKIAPGRPKMNPDDVKTYKIQLSLSPVTMELIARYAEDSQIASFGLGKAAIIRSLIDFALEQKGYLTAASTPAATPTPAGPDGFGWRSLTASAAPAGPQPSKTTAIDAKLEELAQRYERLGHSPERREIMLQKDREWMEKNGIPA